MLRISQKTSGSDTAKYFFGYYAEHELDNPVWLGKGSEKLGLKGQIAEKDFEAVCNNENPKTGEQITDRMIANRTSAYDMTFSVPKSVSIIHGITEDKEILTGFENAIQNTMMEIESHSEVRVRKNGAMENRKAGNLIYGVFTHGESRPVDGVSDPQLHKHVIVPNIVHDETEDKWKAGQFRNIKSNAPYFETVFKSHLADEIQKIGYDIERGKGDFEVKGFNRELIEKFSRRTVEIEERASELGLEYADDKAALGAKTRSSKNNNVDREEQKKEWKGRLTDAEYSLIAEAKNSGGSDQKSISPEQALQYSLSHALARKSVVSEKELLIHGLKRSFGQVTPEQLKAELGNRNDLLSRKEKSGEILYTTKEALAEEKNLIKSAREGLGKHKPIHPRYEIQNKELTSEQALAVQHVLRSKDFITAISGKAGVGKTYSIKEVSKAVSEAGMTFMAVAPSSEASRTVQRSEGFEDATTVADLLQNKNLHSKIKNGVLWVDEPTLLGTATMQQLISLSQKQNTRLLLTGDIYQHNSPERGDAYRILLKYGGVVPASINKIQRQKREDYRQAVTLISEGDVVNGYDKLNNMGAIKESEDLKSLYKNASDEFVQATKKKEQILVVSTTHVQGRIFTETVRKKLKEEKLISAKEHEYNIQTNLNFTNAEKSDSSNYSEGQIIQFHQHVKGGIKRGEKYVVSNISEKGNIEVKPLNQKDAAPTILPKAHADRFSVYEQSEINMSKGDMIRITQNGFSSDKKRLNNGNEFRVKRFDKDENIVATSGKREVVIDKSYGNLTLGYYNTSPSSQGKTVNKVIVLQSSMSGKASNREQLYVSASRGRFSISIHTDDKEHLLNSVQRSSQRMTALELAGDSKHESKKQITKKAIKAGLERMKKLSTLNKTMTHGKSGPTK